MLHSSMMFINETFPSDNTNMLPKYVCIIVYVKIMIGYYVNTFSSCLVVLSVKHSPSSLILPRRSPLSIFKTPHISTGNYPFYCNSHAKENMITKTDKQTRISLKAMKMSFLRSLRILEVCFSGTLSPGLLIKAFLARAT